MKRYLVKLNTPVLIANCTKKTNIYGFLGPCKVEVEEHKDHLLSDIDAYVDYLAAMRDWSSNGDDEFDVADNKNWIDKNGIEHWTCSRWATTTAKKHRKDLDYSLYLIDLDRIDGGCLVCGLDQSVITCESLMETLTRLAEQQKEEENKQPYNVVIFNRPIWLPKHILWEKESGFCHIYGLIINDDLDSRLLQDCTLYLGYLAMIEELTLNDVTPSGYTADVEKDGLLWYDRGEEYTCLSEELKQECQICRHKHNLLLRGATVTVSEKEIKQGVRDGYILSQELYEHIRAITATADYKGGCQK